MIRTHRGKSPIKKAAAMFAAAALVGVGAVLAVAGPASAHTPDVSSTCLALTVKGTNYETKPEVTERSHQKLVTPAVKAQPAVYGDAPLITPAIYVQEYEFVQKNHPSQVRWERNQNWNAGPNGRGWSATGNHRDTTTVLTPAVYGEKPVIKPAVPEQPAVYEKVIDRAAVPADPTPNTITVTIDGKVVADDHFGTSYSNTFNFSDQYTAHSYTVSFVGYTGVGTKTFSGTSTPCVRPDVPINTAPTVDITPPTCEAPYNTLNYDIPEGLSINGFKGKGSFKVEDYPGSFQYGVKTTENITVEKGYSYDGPKTITFRPAIDPGNLDCRPLDASASVKITTDSTCTIPGVPTITAEHASIVGELNTEAGTHTATFTADEGHKFADGTTEQTISYTVPAAIGNQTADPNAPCFTRPEQPEPKVDVSNWVDSKNDCTVDTITQTQTTSTINYVWNEGTKEYEAQEPVITTDTKTRDKSDAEIQFCSPKPDTKVTHTEWKDSENNCSFDHIVQTRETTTIESVWNSETHAWEDGEPVITQDIQQRDKTDAEKAKCVVAPPVVTPPTDIPAPTCDTVGAVNIPKSSPLYSADLDADGDGVACESTTPVVDKTPTATPTPATPVSKAKAAATGQLAYTGSEGLTGVLVIALILLIAGVGIAVSRRRKA